MDTGRRGGQGKLSQLQSNKLWAQQQGGSVVALEALRLLFRRKALVAREGRMLAAGADARTLGELSGPDADRCRALRRSLGIAAGDDAPAFVTGDGAPVADLARFARVARLTALSLDANGGLCRDLLRVRYEKEGVAA